MLGETPGSTFGREETRHSTRKYVAIKPLHIVHISDFQESCTYTCTYNVITTTMGNERNPFHVTQSTHTQVILDISFMWLYSLLSFLFMSANIESFQYLHSLFKHANLLHQRNQHTGTQIQSINAVWRSRKRRGGKRQEHHLRKGRLLDSIVLRHRLGSDNNIHIHRI